MQTPIVSLTILLALTLWSRVLNSVVALPLELIAPKNTTMQLKSLGRIGNDTLELADVPGATHLDIITGLDHQMQNQSITLLKNESYADPRRASFDGTPYVEAWEVECEMPHQVIAFWLLNHGSTSILDESLVFPYDLGWDFQSMTATAEGHAAVSAHVLTRQGECYFCNCFETVGENKESHLGAGELYSNPLQPDGLCIQPEVANACWLIFRCQCMKVLRQRDEPEFGTRDPFSNINNVDGGIPIPQPANKFYLARAGIGSHRLETIHENLPIFDIEGWGLGGPSRQWRPPHSLPKASFAMDTKEPYGYHLEGPDEHYRPPFYGLGEIGGLKGHSVSGFKAKRSLNTSEKPHTSIDPIPVPSSTTTRKAVTNQSTADPGLEIETTSTPDTQPDSPRIPDNKGSSSPDSDMDSISGPLLPLD
ncbi:hypothetical protein TWF481_000221 [Arthrobotrys musiformis]|uniref:Uncharacterized protein n=1 Tax=Arthrobotrys musiformis TaxID=47236 RepID=A0AAV9WNK5_9PEZI